MVFSFETSIVYINSGLIGNSKNRYHAPSKRINGQFDFLSVPLEMGSNYLTSVYLHTFSLFTFWKFRFTSFNVYKWFTFTMFLILFLHIWIEINHQVLKIPVGRLIIIILRLNIFIWSIFSGNHYKICCFLEKPVPFISFIHVPLVFFSVIYRRKVLGIIYPCRCLFRHVAKLFE